MSWRKAAYLTRGEKIMMNQLAKLRKCISRVHFDKYNLKKYMEVLEMLPHLKMIESKGRCALTPGPSLPPGGSQPSQHLRSQLRPFQPAPLQHCIAFQYLHHCNATLAPLHHLRHCTVATLAPLQCNTCSTKIPPCSQRWDVLHCHSVHRQCQG